MGNNSLGLVFIVVMIVAFYLLAIRPNQKRRKETQAMLQALKPGNEIVTTTGMYGKIVAMEADDTVLIEVAPGVTCKYMKQAIMRVVPEVTPSAAPQESLSEPAADDAEPADDTVKADASDDADKAKLDDEDSAAQPDASVGGSIADAMKQDGKADNEDADDSTADRDRKSSS